jgi:hypothetical protein
MRFLRLVLSFCYLVFIPYAFAETDEVIFDKLLQESDLVFTPIAGFRGIPVESDYVMPYEKRLVSSDGQLEVRYAIRPLGRIEIDYEDPHNSAPAPNDLFEMLFRSLSETMAGKSHVYSRAYLPKDAKKDFNAGWATIGVFDVLPDISKDYRQAMLVAIHQNDKADAYILLLTNDLQGQKVNIKRVRDSLKFTSFENDINKP